MNRGLLDKSLREIGLVTAGFGLLLLMVATGISFILHQIQTGMLTMILKLDFARDFLSALLGTPVSGALGPQLIQAFPWVHPLVLLLLFAHETTICTRLPAGETDRGTIDLLLGLPVSRWQLYVCHSLVWALSGLALLGVGLGGIWLGTTLAHAPMAPPRQLAIALINAWCLYLAIGGFACLVSCASERRGVAVGIVIATVVTSFLINFLAGLWPPARHVDFLSVLSYYRPFFILQGGGWPVRDLAILVGAALVQWTAGGVVFRWRDVHTL